jgi:hypothetical protein
MYAFQVAAYNSAGQGSSSTALNFTTASAPTGVQATVTLSSVQLSWTAPATTGGSLTGYEIQWSSDNAGTWSPSTPISHGLTTSKTLSDLAMNASYVFRVRGVNAVGSMTWSAVSSSVTIKDAYGATIQNDAPVGWWRLNEASGTQALDSSGNARHGTYLNATLGEAGPISSIVSAAFNGPSDTTSSVTTTQDFNYERTQAFSISAWVKPSAGSPSGFIAATAPVVSKGWGLFYVGSDATTYGYTGPGQVAFHIAADGTNLLHCFTPAGSVSDAKWSHITAAYAGTSLASGISFVVNGIPTPATCAANTLSATTVSTSPLTIGMRPGATPTPFTGNIADVAVFNKALTSSVSANEFTAATTTPTSIQDTVLADAPVAYYPMNERSGTTSADVVAGRDIAWSGGYALGAPGPANDARAASVTGGQGAVSNLPINTTAGGKNTFSFWMKYDGLTGSMPLSFLSANGTTAPSLYFDGNGRLVFNTGYGDSFGPTTFAVAGNQWVHIAGIWQNGTVTSNRLFVNGREVPVSITAGSPTTGGTAAQTLTGTMRISGNPVNASYRYTGLISNLAVFAKELTADRIAAQYRSGAPAYQAAVMLDGPDAYWRLGDPGTTIADSSGNGTIGTATAAMPSRPGAYLGATASHLDGATAIATSSVLTNRAPDSFTTVEFMMRWDGTSGSMPISFNGLSGGTYNLWMCGPGAIGFNTANSDCYGTQNYTLPVNQWAHIVAVFNNGDTNKGLLYINGVRQNLSRVIASIPNVQSVSSTMYISGYSSGPAYRFSGQLSDVAVFARELPADRILAHYRASGIANADAYRGAVTGHTPIAQWSALSRDGSRWYDRVARRDMTASATRPAIVNGPVTNSQAASFTSTSSGMRVTGLPVTTTANAKHTVQFWMNWDGAAGSSIMAFGDGSSGAYGLYTTSTCFGFNTGNADCFGVASEAVPRNEWTLVTAVFNNGNVTSSELYINGVRQVLSQQGVSLNTSVSGKFAVSGWSGDNLYKFPGLISEVSIVSGAPNAAWPLADYTASMMAATPSTTLQPPTDVQVSYGAYKPITFTNISAGLSVTDNGSDSVTVGATSWTNAWNQSMVSEETITAPATIEFKAPTRGSGMNRMIGFTTATGSNLYYSALNYPLYPTNQLNGLVTYESGAYSALSNGSYSNADTLSISYDVDGYVRYRNGTNVLRTVFAGIGMRFRLGIVWHNLSAPLTDIRWSNTSGVTSTTSPYRVSWQPPAHLSPSGYLIERYSSTGSSYTTTPSETYYVPGSRTSLDISALSNNSSHMFKVRSLQGASQSNATAGAGIAVYTSGTSTFVAPPGSETSAEVLVVAGGAGGGGSVNGGGGGAGGVLHHPNMLISGNYSVSVGAGGIGGIGHYNPGVQFGTNGSNSVFGSMTAIGGGGGSGYYHSSQSTADVCRSGGSGGGGQKTHDGTPEAGCAATQTSSNGAYAFGSNGGTATTYPTIIAAGGGGGAGGVGGDGQTGGGGPGIMLDITGFKRWYAGGGGGGAYTGYVPPYWHGTGGLGGGGNANSVSNGTYPGHAAPNTGGGGGGTGYDGSSTARLGGDGGSGIVVVKFQVGSSTAAPTASIIAPKDVVLEQGVFNPLTFTNISTGLSVTNNGSADVTINATQPTSSWSQSAISQELLTAPFTLRYRSPYTGGPNYRMFGLTTASGSNMSYTSLNYASYPINNTSALEFYESGAYRRSNQMTYNTGDWFSISYDTDGYIRYWVGTKLVRAVAAGQNMKFRAMAAWHSSSAPFEGISYSRSVYNSDAASAYRVSWSPVTDPRTVGYLVEVTSSATSSFPSTPTYSYRVGPTTTSLDLALPNNTTHIARVRVISTSGVSAPSSGSGLVALMRTGSHSIPIPTGVSTVQYLVVAGGGGGGMDMGGGGGAGGYLAGSTSVTPGSSFIASVGAGGTGAPAAGTNGQPSVHAYTISATSGSNSTVSGTGVSLTAVGGGRGGSSYYDYSPGYQGGGGGSGGGASGYSNGTSNVGGGAGTSGQGRNGGNGGGQYYSGGGGGAGAAGSGVGSLPVGGFGAQNSILGPTYWWAGGGGGSGYSALGGVGGAGGGGGGAVGPTNIGGAGLNYGSIGGAGVINSQTNFPGGDAGRNTGGGGGGGSHYNANNKGGEGGSGIVVVRFTAP